MTTSNTSKKSLWLYEKGVLHGLKVHFRRSHASEVDIYTAYCSVVQGNNLFESNPDAAAERYIRALTVSHALFYLIAF